MVQILTLTTIVALATLHYSTQAVDLRDVDPQTIDDYKSGALIIEYYKPDCSKCSDFEPKWNELVQTHQDRMTFGRLNCAEWATYCKEKGITKLPALQTNANGGEWKEYTGDLSTKSVDQFIQANQLKRNAKGESVELKTLDEVKDIISSKEPWFVKFYAPWCGHCKHLAPVWTQMAKELKDKVNVAEINCKDSRDLCQEFKITGLPTLSYFIHGANLKFTGERKLEKLVDYAIKMSGSSVLQIDSDSNLDEVLKMHDVNVVYVQSADEANNQLSLLEQLAPSFMETIPFYTTRDPKTAHRFNLRESDLPAVVLVKDGGYQVYSERKVENISPWILQERNPLVTRILPHNSNRILKGDQVVVLGIMNPDDTASETKLREMSKLCRDQHGKDVMFAQLDGKVFGHYVSRVYGIQSNTMPALVVLDSKQEIYYDRAANKKKFSFDQPEEVVKSLAVLGTLKGISTAPSKTMKMMDKIFIFFGDHWILMTTVLFGFFGILFWLITKDEPKPLTREQIKEIARKETELRSQDKEKKEKKTVVVDQTTTVTTDDSSAATTEPMLVERKTVIDTKDE
ncbi:MAG: hypothetical protein EXX96DRAFT_574157 [Benjaminiella poitrasii]|nr:MAG: hypothetical protein EXX96DRAFT_574157 [Benjaminiella poitrasii]